MASNSRVMWVQFSTLLEGFNHSDRMSWPVGCSLHTKYTCSAADIAIQISDAEELIDITGVVHMLIICTGVPVTAHHRKTVPPSSANFHH